MKPPADHQWNPGRCELACGDLAHTALELARAHALDLNLHVKEKREAVVEAERDLQRAILARSCVDAQFEEMCNIEASREGQRQ